MEFFFIKESFCHFYWAAVLDLKGLTGERKFHFAFCAEAFCQTLQRSNFWRQDILFFKICRSAALQIWFKIELGKAKMLSMSSTSLCFVRNFTPSTPACNYFRLIFPSLLLAQGNAFSQVNKLYNIDVLIAKKSTQ